MSLLASLYSYVTKGESLTSGLEPGLGLAHRLADGREVWHAAATARSQLDRGKGFIGQQWRRGSGKVKATEWSSVHDAQYTNVMSVAAPL